MTGLADAIGELTLALAEERQIPPSQKLRHFVGGLIQEILSKETPAEPPPI